MGIDFVITWVDGSDPDWRAERAKYSSGVAGGNSENRYRDWGLLPYWFRGVEKFTPWVNRIHFVTWGHLPEFLNTGNKKLNIVRHGDFISKEYLPTFSSHAIEMNLHRIPGLSDKFVYFNDDMFVLRPMEETAFFKNGLPCTYGGERPLELVGEIGIWQHAAVNGLGVINAHFDKRTQTAKFGKKYANRAYRWQDNVRTKAAEKLFPDYFTGFKNLHAPAAYLKSTYDEVWNAEPELMRSTCAHKFRDAADVNQWVFLWWQIASGRFEPFSTDSTVVGADSGTADGICETITGQRHDMICVNDPEYEIDFETVSARLKRAFEQILPEKSGFEK